MFIYMADKNRLTYMYMYIYVNLHKLIFDFHIFVIVTSTHANLCHEALSSGSKKKLTVKKGKMTENTENGSKRDIRYHSVFILIITLPLAGHPA